MWPRSFWIDEIRRQRRDSTPIVYAGIQQFLIIRIRKIGRRLNVHVRHKQPRDTYCAQHVTAAWLRPTAHGNFGLDSKILNDDFLNVPIALVQIANRQQRVHSIFHRLANPNQNAGGERHSLLSRFFDRSQAFRGNFIGSVVVGRAGHIASR